VSRSRRKTPICGITKAASEKFDKTVRHRKLRAAERGRLAANLESEPSSEVGISPSWGQKDGKQWIGSRKSAPWFDKEMRK
jgi:hypothetical protein